MTPFSELGLRSEILQALSGLGFQTPTNIQEQAISHILQSKQDLIALAQTGTGKTGAFSLPILSLIDPALPRPQALILCPTRELCLQISKDIKAFLSFLPQIKVAAIYGGDSFYIQERALQSGAQIIVGTPGRTLDMIRKKHINLEKLSWLVLDEADEMLKVGFKEELDAILTTSPATKQTLLFSATIDRAIEQIAKAYMKTPKEISTSARNQGSATITHEYYLTQARDKYETLKRILDIHPEMYGIIFCNTRLETHEISSRLTKEHYTAAPISGELSQIQREQVMAQFRLRQIRILVATDVAARGIDVKELSHVIHYGLPTKMEYYTHRSGRTGRAGSTGTSIAIIHSREMYKIRSIATGTGVKFTSKPIPKAKDICTAQLLHLIEKITEPKKEVVDITPYLPIIEEKLAHLTREELIDHLVTVELGRFITFYKNLPDIHVPLVREPAMRAPSPYKNELFTKRPYVNQNMTSIKLNIGKNNHFSVPKLFDLVNAEPKIQGMQLGAIAIKDDHTTVEVDKNAATQFTNVLEGKKVSGVRLSFGGQSQTQKPITASPQAIPPVQWGSMFTPTKKSSPKPYRKPFKKR